MRRSCCEPFQDGTAPGWRCAHSRGLRESRQFRVAGRQRRCPGRPDGCRGRACTNDKYNGAGVPKLDLKTATVGFAQSEKEANPFRIAETQSIKDEAAKLASSF